VLPGYIANTGRFLLPDCKNVTLSYNPEFIAQGNIMKGLINPDMVLIGEETKEDGDFLEQFYHSICENKNAHKVCRMTAESAEICKLAINCFITTKISFANMIGDVASRTPNANGQAILHACGHDSRIGGKYLEPGFGFGGPCFPRDNRALGRYAQSLGIEPTISSATDQYNHLHADIMVENLLKQNKSEYEFFDVCYKPNCPVPIIEESQILAVAAKLASKGKKVIIVDRKAVVSLVKMDFGNLFSYRITDLPNTSHQ